ncbi:MAG: ABC transporter substrate-binding protein [bacterium]|nr:ABC transporter substrate-binding protein [bacterium]
MTARLAAVLALLTAAPMLPAAGSPPTATADRKPSAATTIVTDLGIYFPGNIVAGIGEPLKVSTTLADEWMRLHPGKKIEYQQIVISGGGEGEWLKTQLMGGIAPEIIHQNAEIAWQDTDKGWYVPLDEYMARPNPYVPAGSPGSEHWIDLFANQDLVNAKRAPDGKLYCVSTDIIETGLFYNKTILKAHGFDRMPDTWAGMDAMFRKLEADGVTPMTTSANGLGSDWGQDIIFEMLYHDLMPQLDLLPSSPDAEGYLGHYLEAREAGFLFTKGFFTRRDPRWREMNRILYEWRRHWTAELKNTDPTRLFLTGRVPVLWDMSFMIRRMVSDPYVDFEWGVTYIPAITRETSRFASGTPATVIGGAATQLHITNSALINHNVEDCVDYLMFLTAPRNIERQTAEALVFIPNVKGARTDPRLEPFQEIFRRRYCAMKWLESMNGEYKKYWRRMLDYYLNDGVDLDGFLAMLDQNFARWVKSHRGEPGWDFTAMEKIWKEREAALSHELDPVR